MKRVFSHRSFVLLAVVLAITVVAGRYFNANATVNSENKFNRELIMPGYEKKLKESDCLCMDKEEELAILEQLGEFAMGKHLLAYGDLTAYWNSYMITNHSKPSFENSIEEWIIKKAPRVKASREHSDTLRSQLQKYININYKIAAIPAGNMNDLLGLNLDGVFDVHMVAVDSNEQNIEFAKNHYKPSNNFSAEFIVSDKLEMPKDKGFDSHFDLVLSNGHDIADADSDVLMGMYKDFYKLLRQDGVLITSFLTPPPEVDLRSTWRNYEDQDALIEKAIFTDILGSKKQFFQTEDEAREVLGKAGFKIVEVIYDSQGMMPTVVARKF